MLPNFLVIGANRAGTTSLYRYLGSHPQVFVSAEKEPTYFALAGLPPGSRPEGAHPGMVETLAAYEELFAGVQGEKAVGEASTAYLANRRAAHQIREAIPDVKLIAVLRDPADRARSAHARAVARGTEPLVSFEAAVDEELAGCRSRDYVKLGFYHESIARYRELFGPDQLTIFLYEDLRDEPLRVLREIFDWLEVDPSFTPDVSRRYNVSVVPKPTPLGKAIDRDSRVRGALKHVLPASARGRLKRWRQARPAGTPPEARRRLVEVFGEDIRQVERQIDRDLSAWLTA